MSVLLVTTGLAIGLSHIDKPILPIPDPTTGIQMNLTSTSPNFTTIQTTGTSSTHTTIQTTSTSSAFTTIQTTSTSPTLKTINMTTSQTTNDVKCGHPNDIIKFNENDFPISILSINGTGNLCLS